MFSIVFAVIGVILNAICIWSITLIHTDRITFKGFIPYLSGIPMGIVCSLLLLPISIPSIILFAIMGGIFGEVLSLFFLIVKQAYQKNTIISYYDDGSPAKFFITGDKHRHFEKVKAFCQDMNTRPKDVLIVLGDAGFNFYDDVRDDELKKEISELKITLFCLHGNKENRPQNVGTYGIKNFYGGKVYYEPKYPNICFAIDGEIYTFEGRKYMVVGGAHSVDKLRCIQEKTPFWDDEMPNDAIKKTVEHNLFAEGNKIYGMLTHTCPFDYMPTEMFISTKQRARIKKKLRMDKSKRHFTPDINHSTEIWLGELEKKIDYKVWFCGHYHIDKCIDKIQMMYHDIQPLQINPPAVNNVIRNITSLSI